MLGSAVRNSPTTRAKTGRTAHVFTAQGGTRRLSVNLPELPIRNSEEFEVGNGKNYLHPENPHYFQEKTPWADSACADCPGFLVLGAADAQAPSFVQEPEAVSLDQYLLHGPFEQNSWICSPVEKWDAQHKFLQNKGAHTDIFESVGRNLGQNGKALKA